MSNFMKSLVNYSRNQDDRKAFCEWYNTPIGQMLCKSEAKFLARTMNITYKQLILQLGSLGWESLFLDEEMFCNFAVIDRQHCGNLRTKPIVANIHELPIATESIDVVIMPHTLEFESDQHQVLREVERVLIPEGQLLLLGFNPWSSYRAFHYLSGRRKRVPWSGRFLRRHRVLDWLGLLNFEAEISAGFYLKSSAIVSDLFEHRVSAFFSIAYAIKAVKRRYTLIPLKPVRVSKPRFVPAEVIETCIQEKP